MFHAVIQARWNDTVEQIYKVLHDSNIEAYHELESALESRLKEARIDSEQFFNRGQLVLLALLDDRQEDIEAHARELFRLRSRVGSFAQRISSKIRHIIELMNIPSDQRLEVAEKMLNQTNSFQDLQTALDGIAWILPAKEASQAIDRDHISNLAVAHLQKGSGQYPLHPLRSWIAIDRFYRRYGNEDDLQTMAQQIQQTMADVLREEGTTHLLMEPVELRLAASPEFVEQFTQDPIAAEWEWVNPAGDCSYQLEKEGFFTITVSPGHDLWTGDRLRAPRLLRPISGDFIMETKLSDGSEGKKFGGLLVWEDERNFARFDVASSSIWYAGCVYYGANVDGKFIHPGIHPFELEEAWLRLERKGDRFTGYVSADGENWYRCGWADIAMQDPIQVGIHALCPQSPATSTRFEYFRIYRPE